MDDVILENVLTVVLLTLATYRGTRLVVEDRLFGWDGVRLRIQGWAETRWIERQVPEEYRQAARDSDTWISPLAYLLSCYWCMSVWVGGVLTLATDLAVGLPTPALVWLTASAVTGLIASGNAGERPEE